MYVLKNPTKRPEGITTQPAGIIINIEPGETSKPLKIADGDIALAKKRGIFEIRDATAAEKKAMATKPEPEPAKTGAETAPASSEPQTAQQLLDSVQGGDDDDDLGGDDDQSGDDFDAMKDEQLIAYLKERDGRSPHPNTSREKLLARARAGEAAGDDEEEGV